MFISMDVGKAFGKIQRPLMIEKHTFSKLSGERKCINLIKVSAKNLQLHIS